MTGRYGVVQAQDSVRRVRWIRVALACLALALGVPAAAGAQRPEILDRARIDPGAGVNFQAFVTPDTVWLGEQVNYQVGVFMDEDTRSRLRRNPEFMPPELRSMLAYDLPTHRSFVRRPGSEDQRLEAYVFRRALFPLQTGTFQIPPATLAYSLPLSRSFFSREESFTRRTRATSVHVRALPAAGQPDDFGGAVGSWQLEAVVDTISPRVGDPVRLTIRVKGEGNVSMLPRPTLELDWAAVTPTRERVDLDANGAVIRGTKEFDWLVTPRDDGVRIVPAIRYPYFDPTRAEYLYASSGAVAVTVLPGAIATIAGENDPDTPLLPIRTAWRGPVPEPPAGSNTFWLVALLAPLPAAGVMLARSRKPGKRRSTPPGEQLQALASRGATGTTAVPPAASSPEEAVRLARQARRLAVLTISSRLRVPPLQLARTGELDWLLRRCGVSPETARQAEDAFARLDQAAYGMRALEGSSDVPALVTRVAAAVAAVDTEASRRPLARRALASRARFGAWLALFGLLSVASAAAVAQFAGAARSDFAAGVLAYQAGDLDEAQVAFRLAARAASRAPDAWANFGTASWAVSDTAGAVVGWQRALRLEPRAPELRTRLALIPGAASSEHATVPPIPQRPLQYLALGLWVLASLATGFALLRRRSVASPLNLSLLGAALLAAGLAGWVHDRADASNLVVVSEGGNLRTAAALGAEPGVSVSTGELVRVDRREGAWSRVTVDRGTRGWIEDTRIIPLHD